MDLIAVILLLAVGIFAIARVISFRALHRLGHKRAGFKANPAFHNCLSLWPDAWLAVKSRNVFAVQRALSLHKIQPCSWIEGFSSADMLFISPPVKGWILVTGADLPKPRQDVDACFRFVLDLSRKLGQVQFFSANHALHYHAWVKAQNGRIVRAYAWAGTTLWQQGSATRAEMDLDLVCFDYGEPLTHRPFEAGGVVDANVEKVPLLAARWGLNPALVQEHFPRNEHGVSGQVVHRYF